MRFLPTRVHGAIDYLWGAALIASPSLLGFADVGSAKAVAWIFGLGAIAYSLVTAYELGVFRLVPMPLHLGLDAVAGAALGLTPLVLGFAGAAAWTFGLFGAFAVVAAFVTRTEPPGSFRALR